MSLNEDFMRSTHRDLEEEKRIERQKAYYNMMNALIKPNVLKSNLAEKFRKMQKTTITVLDLACGRSPSLLVFRKYFLENKIAIKYIGVDTNADQLRESSDLFQTSLKLPDVSFYHLDASKPSNLSDLLPKQGADLIICQHPEPFGEYGNQVQTMLEETLPHYLSLEGSIYASFYAKDEYEIFCQLVLKDKQQEKALFIENNYEPAEMNSLGFCLPNFRLLSTTGMQQQMVPERYVLVSNAPKKLTLANSNEKKFEGENKINPVANTSLFTQSTAPTTVKNDKDIATARVSPLSKDKEAAKPRVTPCALFTNAAIGVASSVVNTAVSAVDSCRKNKKQ